ncbi:S8 family serine peptidase [Wenzhouxiangella sp. XN201]|uniref:S8 family serine peptidase n=1 Tax=Wenzhouxiangella sp. XN201 TaxID=2710755 RepID=UPI0013C7EEED|nr:S8 family serine peptidase [Wenzhouxiangella sp. XN201]NEZ05172.1 S8 family serine peptidase [Wenzhouxiangella sp. XN201]
MKRQLIPIALCLAFAGHAQADVAIDPLLQQNMDAGECPCEVIVTFEKRNDLSQLDVLGLSALKLEVLPMAGLTLSNAEIDLVSGLSGVESIYFNAPLEYFNYNSGQITDGHLMHDTLDIKGRGVTIAVLDSGVDATHPDLEFGTKTIENVKIIGDLGLLGGQTLYAEGQLNTDTSSGHGTHVAGTVGGTGEVSADDPRRPYALAGIAPESDIVGLGAGEAIAILYALIGFDYAIGNQERLGIDIITNSWGATGGPEFDPNNPINKASYEAYRRGMVVLFAAGNDGAEDTVNPYALAPWAISVAAGTQDAQLADFSSRGVPDHPYKHPDITAPGSTITSTRAVNTPLPLLGPVLDPEYYTYYATMSGTSMATPFVAGTAAVLLEANPMLSPDQVLDILMESADPMFGYEFHEVGAGHINVLNAAVLAQETDGERIEFLEGQSRWSASGEWNRIDDTDSRLALSGKWRSRSHDSAEGGSVQWIDSRRGGHVFGRFSGDTLQLPLPRDKQGGVADVYIDDHFHGRVSYFDDVTTMAARAFSGLGAGIHTVELIPIDGRTYFDGFRIPGELFDIDAELVEETTVYTGTMGPSAENVSVEMIDFEVEPGTIRIEGILDWDVFADLDLRLYDPSGQEVASAASLEQPEIAVADISEAGTYTWVIEGYISVLTNYTLESTETSVRIAD